jgi:hypothetical protein
MASRKGFSRRELLTAVPLLLIAGAAPAHARVRRPPDFTGHWAGEVRFTNQNLSIEFFVTKENKRTGKIKGYGTLGGARDFKLKGQINKKGKIELQGTSDDGHHFEIEMHLAADGQSAVGTFYEDAIRGDINIDKFG